MALFPLARRAVLAMGLVGISCSSKGGGGLADAVRPGSDRPTTPDLPFVSDGPATRDRAQATADRTRDAAPPVLTHFTGGFSIYAEHIANAVADGIQVDLLYGAAPSPTDALGIALQANHLTVIESHLMDYLYAYECLNIDSKPSSCQYYSPSKYPGLNSVSALLAEVTKYLQSSQGNPLVVGYWILDDWSFASGSANSILVQINKLIHQITPGRRSICGFGGGVDTNKGDYYWDDGIAANFSPDACDMVGLYLYGEAGGTSTDYDWTMPKVLAAALASLKSRGWDAARTPLLGIPQAFGGGTWVVPSAASVETQAKTYCQHGAIGVIYYAWSDSTTTVFPWNSTAISTGIVAGNGDCKIIWGV